MENHFCRARKGGGCFPVSARMSGVAPSREDVERRTTAPLLGQGIKYCNSMMAKASLARHWRFKPLQRCAIVIGAWTFGGFWKLLIGLL